jgi:hypothetical protein
MLASIEACRPVFLIVMGASLAVIAWRLVRGSSGWAPRLILGGTLLLCFGYSVLMPLYEAHVIERFPLSPHAEGTAATALAWHVVKLFAMNTGWLLLGLGLAIHARVFAVTPTGKPVGLVNNPSANNSIL